MFADTGANVEHSVCFAQRLPRRRRSNMARNVKKRRTQKIAGTREKRKEKRRKIMLRRNLRKQMLRDRSGWPEKFKISKKKKRSKRRRKQKSNVKKHTKRR